MLRCHTPIAFSLKMNKQFSSQFKYWPIILAVLFGAIFCPKTPKNNQFPYIPQDYYPVKIEYIDAPDEIKFSTDLEWADFVNSWNLSKADEQPIENWVFRLTLALLTKSRSAPPYQQKKTPSAENEPSHQTCRSFSASRYSGLERRSRLRCRSAAK